MTSAEPQAADQNIRLGQASQQTIGGTGSERPRPPETDCYTLIWSQRRRWRHPTGLRMNAASSEFQVPYEVQRVMGASGKAARGSLEVIDLLDDKVREFTEYNPGADQNEIRDQATIIVLEYEDVLQRHRAAEELQATADR